MGKFLNKMYSSDNVLSLDLRNLKISFLSLGSYSSVFINSFMKEDPVIEKPAYWFAMQINGLVSIW